MKKTLTVLFVITTMFAAMILFNIVKANATDYTMVDLGTFGPYCAYARGINEAGQIVGGVVVSIGFPRKTNAFLYENGIFQDLGAFGGIGSYALGINNSGQIVGYIVISQMGLFRKTHAFLYENGSAQELGTFGGNSSEARGINDAGQIVGYAETSSGLNRAFLYENGVMHDLGTLGGNEAEANAINNAGQIVGWSKTPTNTVRAFLYENGVMHDLGTLGGGSSWAHGINDAGQIVGYSFTASGHRHAFLYENGVMYDLGTLHSDGITGASYAYSINDTGQIVGYSYFSSFTLPFLYENGVMHELSSIPNYASHAYDINNTGQIVGNSGHHAILWEPGNNNQAPVANAGNGQTVHPGVSVTLDGSNSTDPDNNYPLTYTWTIIEKPASSQAVLSTPDAVTTTLNIDTLGDYRIQLVVTDSLGLASAPDEVTISTTNSAPVADAGVDQAIIFLNDLVCLNGFGSWDVDGDEITYLWTIISVPIDSQATLSDPTVVNPTITPDKYGDYIIQLEVSDPWTTNIPDIVVISTTNLPPGAEAGDNQSCLQGEIVTLDGSDSDDENGDVITYSWQIVSTPDGSSAYLTDGDTVTASLHTDIAGEYVVSLIVNDGLLDSAQDNATVLAVSYADAFTMKMNEIIQTINAMPDSAFKNKEHKDNLTRKLSAILALVTEKQEYQAGYVQLENSILQKLDGCTLNGIPENNDWIISCEYQDQVYPLVIDAMELLDNMT